MKPGIAHDLAVAQSPEGRLVGLHLGSAPMNASAVANHHRDLISHGRELFRFDLPCLQPLEDLLDGSAECGEAAPCSRLHSTDGIYVLDLRVHKFDGPREVVASPRSIEALHDLDVLLRHRPRSISARGPAFHARPRFCLDYRFSSNAPIRQSGAGTRFSNRT